MNTYLYFRQFRIHLSKNNPCGSFRVFSMKCYLQFVREKLVLVSDALDKRLQSLPQVT